MLYLYIAHIKILLAEDQRCIGIRVGLIPPQKSVAIRAIASKLREHVEQEHIVKGRFIAFLANRAFRRVIFENIESAMA